MRRASRNGRLYTGPCPFCPDGGDDRFHVWMEASAGRPAERYWCRVCNARGLLRNLGRNAAQPAPPNPRPARRAAAPLPRAEPNPAHTRFYRELYQATACWAHSWLLDGCHPDPLRYLHRRGLSDATIGRYLLGVTLGDPDSLVAYLQSTCPEAFPYAEEAGLLARDDAGRLRAHWNLCGRILFPYIAGSQVVDLRTRTYDGQKGYRSLGPYAERGASFPFAWDSVAPGTTTVIVAEAELKALIALQAFHAGDLAYPTIGQPGLTVFRPAWAEGLQAKGVREVVLCYDSQPRRAKDGLPTLTPEEQWCLRHGATCAAAGMQVRVACLPLPPDADKAEIDTFIPEAGAAAFQQLIDSAPLLSDYHRSISQALLERHNLLLPNSYPTRRPRPLRQALAEASAAYALDSPAPAPQTLPEARAAIAAQAEAHASAGLGFLVLAHPPGIGKGHNTTLGLRSWLQKFSPGATGRPFLVWTALRKGQLADQEGLTLIPLDGRGPQNCRKLPEASTLAQKGYGVKEALCVRRCPHLDHCAYLRQFGQVGDFFAATPLLKATGWWQQAGLIVLDEFDPSSLISHVQLRTTDLAAMSRANAGRPAIQTVLRWVAQAVATTTDRTLVGGLFLDELARQAAADAAPLDATLQSALEELPPAEQLNLLVGLPNGASLADYQALPPAHTPTLLHLIVRERGEQLAGRRRTSRLEARGGRLELYLRVEHLIAQLARPEQPKLILDATANPALLRALFPATPIRVERPHIPGALRVVQVVGRDWAKSSLRIAGKAGAERRLARWCDEVAGHIRPDRPTLVVCTLEWEEQLRAGLVARGYSNVTVAHYGALRGSNAFRGYDVILAQVYHPNLEQVVREGRALFADDETPLDERVVLADTPLHDATGTTWQVSVPTFADPRLQALLAQRREAELLQCALRGRPFDHAEAQITLLFSLPVPGLAPTLVVEAAQSPESNASREAAVRARLCAAARQLLDRGLRALGVEQLAAVAGVSVVTVRKHWAHIAARLGLRALRRRRVAAMPRGGARAYLRMVLVPRGRFAPPVPEIVPELTAVATHTELVVTTDQARKRRLVTGLIGRRRALLCLTPCPASLHTPASRAAQRATGAAQGPSP